MKRVRIGYLCGMLVGMVVNIIAMIVAALMSRFSDFCEDAITDIVMSKYSIPYKKRKLLKNVLVILSYVFEFAICFGIGYLLGSGAILFGYNCIVPAIMYHA